jgi:hypothetical protein
VNSAIPNVFTDDFIRGTDEENRRGQPPQQALIAIPRWNE